MLKAALEKHMSITDEVDDRQNNLRNQLQRDSKENAKKETEEKKAA